VPSLRLIFADNAPRGKSLATRRASEYHQRAIPLPPEGAPAMPDLTLLERLPTPAEYRALCESVGWGGLINFDAAPDSLARSLFGVVVTDGDTAIGMGRIVGDGVMYFYVQDVAVNPAYQGRGVGVMILRALLDYVRRTAPDQAFVGLFAAQGTQPFYRRFGFDEHPDDLVGMFTVTPLG
jgi:GNAT superfamily N-acetyltransferase